MPHAVILLSGGLDSTTAAVWAQHQGYSLTALSLDYGQRHRIELERAKAVAGRLGIDHITLKVDLTALGGSALTDDAVEVPKDRDEEAIGEGVPITYVPARNTLLLSLALGLAEIVSARHLVIGVSAVDFSGYPDCRPEFLRAFEKLAKLATKAGAEEGVNFEVLAPLLGLSKGGTVRLGLELGAPYELTWSCYDPQPGEFDVVSCGRCDSCQLRLKGFKESGTEDPVPYAQEIERMSDETNEPICAQPRPYVQECEPGKKAWCACGRSRTQPFCDGSHKGTGISPVIVDIDEKKTVAWCGCKKTGNQPFCDGSHSRM